MNEVGDNLGVGVRGEFITRSAQPASDLLMVLDDAVMHNRQSIPADMRMRIALTRRAMRGPARVRDAERPLEPGLVRHVDEVCDATDAAKPVQPAVDDRQSGRVVATVFEFPQSLEEDGNDVTLRDRAYDSTHTSVLGDRGLADGLNGIASNARPSLGTLVFEFRNFSLQAASSRERKSGPRATASARQGACPA